MSTYNNRSELIKRIPPFQDVEYKAGEEIEALDIYLMRAVVGNIYKMIVILGKRANQINDKRRERLYAKLEEYRNIELEDDTHIQEERLALVKEDEQKPKPSLVAIEEYSNGKLAYMEGKPLF